MYVQYNILLYVCAIQYTIVRMSNIIYCCTYVQYNILLYICAI